MNKKNKITAKEKRRLPIGISSFKKLRENDYYYIDKTHFIRDVIEASAEALLLPRPRRFGKTLNLSMLRYFFEKSEEDRNSLFDGLIIRNDEVFDKHQGRYPVIYLTFKDVKEASWDSCFKSLQSVIYEEYSRHRYLQDAQVLFPDEKTYIQKILAGELEKADYGRALKNLSAYLFRYYEEQVVILIDEYDTPLHSGYANGYYKEVIDFMRNFLSGGFKDNEHLFKGVITGILRVAKESIFSGLNNLGVYTLLSSKFSASFGFTESEMQDISKDYKMDNQHKNISYWYNGYQFGKTVIYNPWSVLNCIDNQGEFKPYWINTASTEIIDNLITRGGKELREEIGQLLENKTITKPIYENIVIRDLEKRDDLVWSFMLFSGYLTYTGERSRKKFYELKIPNEEVKLIYEDFVDQWFAEKVESNKLERLLNALKAGDVELFEELLSDMVKKVLSWHDTAGPEPEQFYHAFVLGLLIWMTGEYEIKSNRESGLGRYDVVLIPIDRDKPGIIMEFKKVKKGIKETPEKTLLLALEQIEDRDYAADLEAAGIKKILKLAIAFRGKELWVRQS